MNEYDEKLIRAAKRVVANWYEFGPNDDIDRFIGVLDVAIKQHPSQVPHITEAELAKMTCPFGNDSDL